MYLNLFNGTILYKEKQIYLVMYKFKENAESDLKTLKEINV